MSLALVCPGQGAQRVGMMQDLLASSLLMRKRLAQASELAGFDLAELVVEGPAAELNRTDRAQPVLFALEAALFEEANLRVPGLQSRIAFCAGHSLGEYTALFVAGVLDFAAGVKLTSARGRLMAETSVPGGMCAVLGLDEEIVASICVQASTADELCVTANINAPGQIVISGASAALARAEDLLKAAGARRVVPLAVSGPFHSPYMKPVAEAFASELEAVEFHRALCPVVANSSAKALVDADDLKSELIEQLTSGVQWVKSVQLMQKEGVKDFLELGSKGLLGGMIKRIWRQAHLVSIYNVPSLEAFAGGD